MGYNYYPFGLTFNSYQRVTAKQNKYLFNGIERQTDLNLGWDLAEYRSYSPELGRWHQIDPKTSERESPYVGFANNPIINVDPLGDTAKAYLDKRDGQITYKTDEVVIKTEPFTEEEKKEFDKKFGFILTNGGEGGEEPATETAEIKEIRDIQGLPEVGRSAPSGSNVPTALANFFGSIMSMPGLGGAESVESPFRRTWDGKDTLRINPLQGGGVSIERAINAHDRDSINTNSLYVPTSGLSLPLMERLKKHDKALYGN